jgi:thymidylate kinase
MIVELFGPPAAGKTTVAHALTTALKKHGCEVQLIASSRPAERGSIQIESKRASTRCRAALAAPLSRAVKLLSAMYVSLPSAQSDELTAKLMDLLPPVNRLWSVRYRRYLSLLSRSWKIADASDRIVIFDQAFLTALCSLVVLARRVDRMAIARALELIPYPSLLIRLDAPRELLEARLRERLERQGALERLFEVDLQTSLRQIEITSKVADMLQQQGRGMMNVSCLDRLLLERSVDRILREIRTKLRDQELDDQVDRYPYPAAAHRGRDSAGHHQTYSSSQ